MTRRNIFIVMCAVLMIGACKKESAEGFRLDGAWSLTHLKYPEDVEVDFPSNGRATFKIYEGDSVLYNCQLIYTGSGIVVVPLGIRQITLKELGGGERIYMEDDDLCPLVVVSDSVMTTQHWGRVHTWVRASDMSEERIREIKEFIRYDEENGADELGHYVLFTTERKLQADNHRLGYALMALTLVLLVAVYWGMAKHRKAKLVSQRLREIEEERMLRPSPVRKVMKEVEQEFFESDYYLGLYHDLSEGKRMKKEDWEVIEHHLNAVYPNFTNHLLGLYPMSEMEYQISLLVKLRISPKCIASVLMRDVSSISSTRKRLYRKIFNKMGSSKDWDDFVLSIGS